MLRRSRAFLIGMAAVLTMLLVPATFTTEAAPTPCAAPTWPTGCPGRTWPSWSARPPGRYRYCAGR